MDEPKIRLYPGGKPGSVATWHWELLLNGKKIAGAKFGSRWSFSITSSASSS